MPAQRTILVVDDDTFLRMLVAVELPDYRLVEATSIDDGYELARREKPDAILLDLRLSDGDGMELLRKVRQTPPLAQTPVLVITAGHDEANRPALMKAGADEYLPKPLEGPDLIARLERIIDLAPKQRRVRRQDLLNDLGNGVVGDPDPVPEPDPNANGRRSRGSSSGRRRLFGRNKG